MAHLENNSITLPAGLDSLDSDALRQRVAALEVELETVKNNAETHHEQHHSPEATKMAKHAHHVGHP